MSRKEPYWIGARPSKGKRWAYASHAVVVEDLETIESVFRMQRRYAKQWNDIELDIGRNLGEHDHEVFGAMVVGRGSRFILHGGKHPTHWVLEIWYERGFKPYHPGWSFGKNPFRSHDDMKSVRLHFSPGGDQEFRSWLLAEKDANRNLGEWTEYR